MTRPLKLAAAVLAAALASPALADVIATTHSVELVPVDNSAALTGYATSDLQVTTLDSDWTSAALLLELTAGSIYQEPEGFGQNGSTLGAPDPAGFGIFPSSEFDTYLDGNGQSIAFAGAAGDVGGDVLQFDTAQIDASWYDIAADDTGTFNIARVTLSDDAVGTWSLFTTTADEQRLTLTGSITDGVIEIETEMIELLATTNSTSSPPLTRTRTQNSIPSRRSIFWFSDSDNPYEIDKTGLSRLFRLYTLEEIEQLIIELGLDPADAIRGSNTFTFPGGDRSLNPIGPLIYVPETTEPALTASIDSTLPEPGTVALLGLGGLGLLRRRRR